MELDVSLSWLALALTPGLASRLSARLLREFGSPEGIFRARLPQLEACRLPAPVAQAVFKKQSFGRAEKELALTRRMDGCRLLNWTDPEYPQTLLQIYDPPVLLYVRGDPRSEEHTSELQSQSNLVCRLLLEKKKTNIIRTAASTALSRST